MRCYAISTRSDVLQLNFGTNHLDLVSISIGFNSLSLSASTSTGYKSGQGEGVLMTALPAKFNNLLE